LEEREMELRQIKDQGLKKGKENQTTDGRKEKETRWRICGYSGFRF
jgi:hypothetical protein